MDVVETHDAIGHLKLHLFDMLKLFFHHKVSIVTVQYIVALVIHGKNVLVGMEVERKRTCCNNIGQAK